ncbi:MAG: hypothetical protein D3910_24750, partial [Candidatus Electrothrix sp. ATG2]|nr:hypothetical protein [Candidatus Electrothrix sp. ATG2]
MFPFCSRRLGDIHTDPGQGLFCAGDLTAKAELFRGKAQGQSHQLREKDNGHLVSSAKMTVGLALIGIYIELTHGTDRDHDVGLALFSGGDQAADQLIGCFRANLGH